MNVAAKTEADRKALSFAMALSLAIGLLMFVMKVGAYLLTGWAAILSDAAEPVVHVAAVIFAAWRSLIATRPGSSSLTSNPWSRALTWRPTWSAHRTTMNCIPTCRPSRLCQLLKEGQGHHADERVLRLEAGVPRVSWRESGYGTLVRQL